MEVLGGVWCVVVCGVWCVVLGVWCGVCGVWWWVVVCGNGSGSTDPVTPDVLGSTVADIYIYMYSYIHIYIFIFINKSI